VPVEKKEHWKSTRTADIIKSVKVLTAQYAVYRDIDNPRSKPTELEHTFIRYAVEEHLRRHANAQWHYYHQNPDKMISLLDPDFKTFLSDTKMRRKHELDYNKKVGKVDTKVQFHHLERAAE